MIDIHVRKLHALLKSKIDERGTTPDEVDKAVGWKAGTVGRLLAGDDELSVKQAFSILGAIGVDPDAFFAELYGLTAGPLPSELAELQAMIGSIVNLLVKNGVVTADAVARAVAAHTDPRR